jgi:hypothetical protein
MPHYAQINSNNIVTNVLVVDSSIIDPQTYLADTLGLGGIWVETSYNTHGGVHYAPNTYPPQPDGQPQIGYNYAAIGYNYDSVAVAFYAPQPFPSWTLDNSTYLWNPPTPMPQDAVPPACYQWDETNLSWVLINL